jgi:hypothetical protein
LYYWFWLSVLWLELPIWLYSIIVLASFVQDFTKLKIVWVRKNWINSRKFTPLERFILFFVGAAFFGKLLLQLVSTIPAKSALHLDLEIL